MFWLAQASKPLSPRLQSRVVDPIYCRCGFHSIWTGLNPRISSCDESSVLQFIGGILIVLGIISLIVGFVTKAARTVSLRDVAIAIEVAAVCLLYLTHNSSLSFMNLVVPELVAIVGLVWFIVSRRQMN